MPEHREVTSAADVAGLLGATGYLCDDELATVTYLALAKVGPIRTRTRVLSATPEHGSAHVEIVDTGAGDRLTTVARVVAARP